MHEYLTSYSDIEEFFLSVSKEYIPFITNMIDDNKRKLDNFGYIDKAAERIKDQLLDQFEFWDLIQENDQAFQKIQLMQESPFYLKYLCRLIKRNIENAEKGNFKPLFDVLVANKTHIGGGKIGPLKKPLNEHTQGLYEVMYDVISHNISWRPQKLAGLLKDVATYKMKVTDNELEIRSFSHFIKELSPALSHQVHVHWKEIKSEQRW